MWGMVSKGFRDVVGALKLGRDIRSAVERS